MFDPEKWADIVHLDDADLTLLPTDEDDRHEYKSSLTSDKDLGDKIANAASGFWNSGGGLFVVGAGKNGQPDGGISLTVGRQSRRDWIDQAISSVTPRARYAVQCIEDHGAGLNIRPGSAVVLIGFAPSEVGPHMSRDNRYYVRAGAHTLPATHFIVEAIHARRGLRTPILRHVVRLNPEGGESLQLGLVCLNDAPALNVEIELTPVPSALTHSDRPNFVVPVVSRETPFYFDFHYLSLDGKPIPPFQAKLKYADLANRPYEITFDVNVTKQLGPDFGRSDELRDLVRAIESIANAIKH